jgi:hypothetical protein
VCIGPNILIAPSVETIAALCHLHPLAKVDLLPFIDDFHPKTNLVLDRETFIYALTSSPHLSFNNPSSMVYELYEIVLSLMILLMALIYILKYASTSFVVISSINIMLACCVATISFGKTIRGI